MISKPNSLLATTLSIFFALALSSCSSSSDDDGNAGTGSDNEPTQSTSTTYNGAGSKWDLTINSDDSCSLSEELADITIEATCELLDSGFIKISVLSSSGDGAPEAGATTYGFELSGYMLPFVSFSDNKLIPTVVAGDCPTQDIKHNFIVAYARSNDENSNFDSWGTFGHWQSDYDAKTLTVEIYRRDGSRPSEGEDSDGEDTVTVDMDLSTFCTNGETYDDTVVPEGDDPYSATTTAYWTKSGGLIWHQEGHHDDRIENDFMIPYDDGISQLSQLDGDYIGYTISGNGQTSYASTPVSVSATNGVFALKQMDVEANSVSSYSHSEFTLSSELEGTRGLFTGQITQYDETTASKSEGLGCAVDLNAGDSGKNVIICGGMLPDGSLENLYSAILVSK